MPHGRRRCFVGPACAAFVGLALAAPPAQAQQNLFNVPSGKITKSGDLFFQQQFNITRPAGSSNTTFDFGLGNGFEAGFNVLDVVLYDRGSPSPVGRSQVNPDLLFNAQKGFELVDEVWNLGVGLQAGINPAPRSRDVRFQNFTWVINGFELPDERGSVYVGAYYANVAYGGPGDRFGLMLGTEIPVIKDVFHFQADYLSGARDIGVGVVGGVFFLPGDWQLSVGAQFPAFRSHNPYGVVLELTLPSYPLFRRRGAE